MAYWYRSIPEINVIHIDGILWQIDTVVPLFHKSMYIHIDGMLWQSYRNIPEIHVIYIDGMFLFYVEYVCTYVLIIFDIDFVIHYIFFLVFTRPFSFYGLSDGIILSS